MTATAPRQLWMGGEEPTAARFTSVRNDAFSKPAGGLWTTPVGADGSSAWVEFCDREHPGGIAGRSLWSLTIAPQARVAVIDSQHDLDTLLDRFPDPSTRDRLRPTLDFEAMSAVYDGIHLTDRGQKDTALTLVCWDFPCTLWLNWVVTGAHRARTVTRPALSAHDRSIGR